MLTRCTTIQIFSQYNFFLKKRKRESILHTTVIQKGLIKLIKIDNKNFVIFVLRFLFQINATIFYFLFSKESCKIFIMVCTVHKNH